MKESVTYQAILQEGEAIGYKRAYARAFRRDARALRRRMLRSLARGRVLGVRTWVLKLGTSRFGKPNRKTQAAIKAINSPKTLMNLLVRCVKASSWNELLGQNI